MSAAFPDDVKARLDCALRTAMVSYRQMSWICVRAASAEALHDALSIGLVRTPVDLPGLGPTPLPMLVGRYRGVPIIRRPEDAPRLAIEGLQEPFVETLVVVP